MPLDVLPDDIIVKSRDEWLALYLRSHKLRAPLASVDQDSEPYVTGSALADQLNIQSENARQIGRSIPLASVGGKKLDALLASLGLPPRFPQTGSQGAIRSAASTTGSTIAAGEELIDQNGQRFQCTTTALYFTGQNVPIAALSTGPLTNLAPNTKLTWSSPPPGCFPQVLVATQSDGTGLSGGRLSETDDEVRGRISNAYANPAAAGNNAAYQQAIEFSQGHGVAVQRAFTYPAALGPGTIAFCFTLGPGTPGTSRVPNATQIQQVHDYVVGQFPNDDQLFACVLSPVGVIVAITVTWADGASGWVDAVPWPVYRAPADTTPAAFVVSAATSAVSFSVDCRAGLRTGAIAPQPGNTFAVYDIQAGVFRQKKIAYGGVSGDGPWALTMDVTNGASDTIYTPAVGEPVCPWSDSLASLVPAVLAYFATLGPGEQFATFFDPGLRLKRSPASPRFWPSTIGNRLVSDILDVASVEDAQVVEGLGATTPIGAPGAASYLIELAYMSAFPPR